MKNNASFTLVVCLAAGLACMACSKLTTGSTLAPPPAANVEKPEIATQAPQPPKAMVYQYLPDANRHPGTEILLSEICQEIAGKVYYELKDKGENYLAAKVAVVTAVPLADLKRETEFGRVVGEYLLTDFADRGLRVIELRLGQDISILPRTGEFIMSRNIGELANNSPELDYVVISTFTNTRKTLIMQGRLVSLASGLVESSWRYNLPLNRELLGLFHKSRPASTIAMKGMVQ